MDFQINNNFKIELNVNRQYNTGEGEEKKLVVTYHPKGFSTLDLAKMSKMLSPNLNKPF